MQHRKLQAQSFVQRGGLWVAVQFVLLVGILVAGESVRGNWGTALSRSAGVVLLTVGGICGLAGALALGGSLTPFPRPSDRTRLVRHGIYRFIRHPLYTAVCSAAFGWSLLMSSWGALLMTLALAVFFDAKARREERWLSEKFPDYAGYKTQTKRFIPWVY